MTPVLQEDSKSLTLPDDLFFCSGNHTYKDEKVVKSPHPPTA